MQKQERFLLMCILSLHLKEKKQVQRTWRMHETRGFGDKGTAVHTHKSAQAYDTEHHIPSSRWSGNKVIVVYRHCTFDAFVSLAFLLRYDDDAIERKSTKSVKSAMSVDDR